MILVTGGTGFIGQALIRQLTQLYYPVRVLLRPSKNSPRLPEGVPVEVVICSLSDERGLRAAMQNVQAVYHLAGTERQGSLADLQGVDVDSTQRIAQIAQAAGVQRLFFLSHLGADRHSAYTVLQAKARAEAAIVQSRVPYTIFRSAVVYGPNDSFTNGLARLIRRSVGVFPLPGDGSSRIQPLYIEDLVTCLTLALEDASLRNTTLEIGGPEYLTIREVVQVMLKVMHLRRALVPISPIYLRWLLLWLESARYRVSLSVYWQDYLASDRTCALDTLPRRFGLLPARFARQIEYLRPTRPDPAA